MATYMNDAQLKKRLKDALKQVKETKKQAHFSVGQGLEAYVYKDESVIFYARVSNGVKENGTPIYTRTKLGSYLNPAKLTLASAREKALKLKNQAARSPESTMVRVQTPTFLELFNEWIEVKAAQLDPHGKRVANFRSLKKHLIVLDRTHIGDYDRLFLVNSLQNLKTTEFNIFACAQMVNQMLEYAANKGYIPVNPMSGMLTSSESPIKRPKREHLKYVKAEKLKELVFSTLTKAPLLYRAYYLLQCMTASRSSECRELKWEYIKPEKDAIYIPKTKTGDPRVIPLTKQTKIILKLLKSIQDQKSDYVFQGTKKNSPIAYTSLTQKFLACTGGIADLHGFRSSFKSWCSENKKPREIAEMCLNHNVLSSVEASYDRYTYLTEKRDLFQQWNDYIVTQLPPEFLELLEGTI